MRPARCVMTHLLDYLQDRVLLCDGAMGTQAQSRDFEIERDFHGHENCTEILTESRPDFVLDVHRAYLQAGADAVQIVSALLRHGPGHLRQLIAAFRDWADEHEYESLDQMRGSMSLARCPDPASFERGNYVRILQSWETRHDSAQADSRRH